jgi:hypothetical protein
LEKQFKPRKRENAKTSEKTFPGIEWFHAGGFTSSRRPPPFGRAGPILLCLLYGKTSGGGGVFAANGLLRLRRVPERF